MKHRKGEKVIFCEETDEKVTQSGSSDILKLNENKKKKNGNNEAVLGSKESANIKDKKKKKKHFI